MQKINVFLPLLILTSFYLQAAPQTPVNTLPAAPEPAGAVTPPDTATAGQEQIVSALQDNITFERQKRQLSNELALEKLRAELQKVRGENAPVVATMPVAPPVATTVREETPAPVPRRSAPPSVVLVSQVAGVSRVGVSVNGQLQFVSRSEKFSANGKHYRLVPTKNNQFIVREVK
ncbi:lngG [Salmonella enterica subsp. enterica serovar Amager]|nr:lngG [Salmonella enterica subsp. enterica serovar Amager]EBV5221263.1 lngG [Salmonella enterica subsp. enterica serovar Amager]EBW4030554.1 lngG [Salmonella enterica subsp. enterica serovar Newport]